jgi:dihydrodipicolinate synthase/N-acetylneuraminate lyase
MSAERPAKAHGGVIVPMVTPFTADGRVDRESAERLTDHLVEGGCHPFVLGTTGEGASIPKAARAELVRCVVERAARRAKVYAGISTNVLETAVDTARQYLQLGADAVVAHPPSYFPITGDDMLAYFELLADRVGGPLILYNIPITTHLSIPLDVVETLSHHPNIVGLKDSESGLPRLKEGVLRWAQRPDFSHLVGAAEQGAYGLELGSDGVVPSAGNLVPRLHRELYEAALRGEHETARRLQERLDALSSLYVTAPALGQSLAALKVMASVLGLCEPHMLPPLRRLPREEEAALRERTAALALREAHAA